MDFSGSAAVLELLGRTISYCVSVECMYKVIFVLLFSWFFLFFLTHHQMTKVLFLKEAFLKRKWRLFSYSSPNDLSCSSWYSNAILSSKASDTSWCNSFMVRATTELFSRISWILHCKARQSLLIPVKETILDIRECSTRGGNWKIKYF